MKANKINIDEFINDTITELQKHEDGAYFIGKLNAIRKCYNTRRQRYVINEILKNNDRYGITLIEMLPLLKDSTEYLAKYKELFNSNKLYINEVETKGTKGKITHVFLFDGASYSLCDNVGNGIKFYLYGTTSLNVDNVKNKENKIHICKYTFATVLYYCCYELFKL